MEESLEFIKDIKKYIENRKKAIESKNDLLVQLKKNYQDKLDEINDTEKVYKVSFDDKIFDKLTLLKEQLEEIKNSIKSVQDQLELMDVGIAEIQIEDIEKQIVTYIGNLNLEKLKENIMELRKDYIENLNAFVAAINEIQHMRYEINDIQGYINKNIKTEIRQILGKYCECGEKWLREICFKNPNASPIDHYDYNTSEIDIITKKIKDMNYIITSRFVEE